MRKVTALALLGVFLIAVLSINVAATQDLTGLTHRFRFNSSLLNATGSLALTGNGNAVFTTLNMIEGNASRYYNATSAGTTYDAITSGAGTNFGAGDFSILFWINWTDNFNGANFLSNDNAQISNGEWIFQSSSGYLYFVGKDSGGTQANCPAPNTTFGNGTRWNRIAVVREDTAANGVKIYMNGVQTDVCTVASTLTQNELYVGSYPTSGSALKGNIDDLMIYAGTALSAQQIADDYSSYNASGVTSTPSWVAPTPADASANNTQVVLNVSGSDANTYFIWFDTNPDPVTLVVNNATLGNWTTNVSSATQTYYYKAQAWNSSTGYSDNTSVRSWTFDAVAPAIQLNPTNEFNAQNYSLKSPYDRTLNLNVTFTDDHDLYAMEINVTRGGVSYYNLTNETLSGTSYTFTNAVSTSSWPVGRYNVTLFVSDSHTATAIPDYQVTKKKSSITFKPGNDNNIKVETQEPSTITATKLLDRYSFTVAFDDGLTKSRVFEVKTDLCPLTYKADSGYKAHFVSYCGKGGNWVDFEGVGGVPVVTRVDDFHYRVALDAVPPVVTFNSIGGLNTYNVTYSFYNGNYSINDPDPVYALETYTYLLNLTRDDTISSVDVTVYYNTSTPTATSTNTSSLYAYSLDMLSPNATMSHTYYWQVTVTQGDGNVSLYNISQTQQVNLWSVQACGSPQFINWTQYDEENPTNLLTGTFKVEIEYWVGNTSNAKTYNATFGSATSWAVCFTPVTDTFYANVYAQNTVPTGFTHRFYVQNATYSNTTTLYSIYNFNDTTGISDLKITTRKNENYAYFKDVFAQLQRRYVGEGVWRTVQYDKSGDFGLVFFNVREEDTDYRLKYYDSSNNLLLQTESLKFVCTSTVCELTQLLEPAGTSTTTNYTASVSYNNETKIITVTWDTLSSQSETATLLVTKQLGNGITTICDDSQTGAAGTFTCNVTGYTGQLFVYAAIDGEGVTGEWVSISRTQLSSLLSQAESALWTFGIMVCIVGFGLFSPMALVITTVFGLIVAFWLGIMGPITTTFIIVAAVIGFGISLKVRQ